MSNICVKCSGHRPVRTGGRGLCESCYHVARRTGTVSDWPLTIRPVSELIADVTELLELGECPERVCERLGRSATGIMRAMYRANKHELARPFGRLAKRQRREAL